MKSKLIILFILCLFIINPIWLLENDQLQAEDINWEEYKNKLENELADNPEDVVLNFELAVVLANLGEVANSYDIIYSYDDKLSNDEFSDIIQPHLENLKTNHPDKKILIWNQYAFSYLIEKKYKKSVTYFNKILKRQPENIWIKNYLAATHIELDNKTRAEEIAQETLEIKNNQFSHLILGIIYYQKGQYIQSIKKLNQAGDLFKSMLKYF